MDKLSSLKTLAIDANHKLHLIEDGVFKNLTNLQHLSISYNTHLQTISPNIFQGLINLQNLTLINNGFTKLLDLTHAFKPSVLPSLKWLDLSENAFDAISEYTFQPMKGTTLQRLNINLCRLDFIHPNSLLPLTKLRDLSIGENDLNASMIGDFLLKMKNHRINLSSLDLSGMGFRKQPPKGLMDIISQTTIKVLILANNQFEFIHNDTFPRMVNIEIIDLRKVLTMSVASNAFDQFKFPNLKVLLMSGNNLFGIHKKHISDQLVVLDLSNNNGNPSNVVYFDIDRDAFSQLSALRELNLSYNRIKSIFNYTFLGLANLKMLSIENTTLYHIESGTFKHMKHLEILNLANNPLTTNGNLTSSQFEGLNNLSLLILKNCGIKYFNDDDNIFEMMPNLTQLNLRNNLLFYITAETLKPLKMLSVLDLSENLLVSWWKPLFLISGVKPLQLYLTNNKISHFSISMIQDISYLLENRPNLTVQIDLMNNIFSCDCSTMFETYLWIQKNGSREIKEYFENSNLECSTPDVWENKRVADYMSSVKKLRCIVYKKISNFMLLVWTAPSLITILLLVVGLVLVYKYRIYLKYWMFLAKIALGRKLISRSLITDFKTPKTYIFDAFISYCNEDRHFVSELVKQLETLPPHLRLCLYERDFEIGAMISEAVLKSIYESKYVILVVSNNFAKSQWCRWETQLAEHHRLYLDDGMIYDPLVLIKLGDIEKKYQTTTLRYLMKTKIYHAWDERKGEEFWKKLRCVLSK
ncbi:hypothetical protein ACJJTC_013338 [Scirpophaga incertulas]